MSLLDPLRSAKHKTQKVTEPAYLASLLRNSLKPAVPETPYVPASRSEPPRRLDASSSWDGIETILADIIQRFNLKTDSCCEFGVEYGFSTAALSGFFTKVTGVDTFEGDAHAGLHENSFLDRTAAALAPFPNITLVQSDYRKFIENNTDTFDLIHVDIIHTYAATYECGLWSAQHSTCTIFHDTESFPAVKQVVADLARVTGKRFYNFEESNGLGILV